MHKEMNNQTDSKQTKYKITTTKIIACDGRKYAVVDLCCDFVTSVSVSIFGASAAPAALVSWSYGQQQQRRRQRSSIFIRGGRAVPFPGRVG